MDASKPKTIPSSSSIPPPGLPASAGSTNLQREDPEATDQALLAQLERSLLAPVSIRTRWRDPEDGESYEVLDGVDWPAMTLAKAQEALAMIEAAQRPADEPDLGFLLYQLWLATSHQNTAADDMQGISRVYIAELRQHPGDIALEVLRQAKRQHKWFPSLSELTTACMALGRQRSWLTASLQGRIKRLSEPEQTRSTRPSLQHMPGTRRSEPAPGGASWLLRRKDALAQLLGIAPGAVLDRLHNSSDEQLAELARRLEAAEGSSG